MWDFIIGKRIVHVMKDGQTLEVMAEGVVSQMRDKLRARFKTIDKANEKHLKECHDADKCL